MKITGISVVVPDNVILIEDEMEFFDNNPKLLSRNKKILGLGSRYVIPYDCNATATDLCEAAAKKLIEDMKVDVNEIDAIVAVFQAPDYSKPGSGCVLHGKLNLPDSCAAFDVNHGCAGYTYGLWIAGSMIESGACKKVLLLAGDKPGGKRFSKDNILFGDAGSATMLEYSEDVTPSYFGVYADGKGYDNIITPFGGARVAIDEEISHAMVTDKNGNKHKLMRHYMNGLEVFKFTVSKVPPSIKETMDYAVAKFDDIDFFALHQANKQIVDSVVTAADIPVEKCSSATFTKFGNQSTTTVPAVIAHLLSEKVANSKQRLFLSGFGIGLAWCNAIVELDHIYCPGISYQNFDYVRSKDEEVSFWTRKILEKINND
jgi:3-oxoacyl-[acyl-carrier-protein] synthase-3